MSDFRGNLSPPDVMQNLLLELGGDADGGLKRIEALLGEYPADPRLHFLKGSMQAQSRDYAGARTAMAKAVTLDPKFGIARFQLGFLELTSGDLAAAEATWAPFDDAPASDPLRLFAAGMLCVAHDEFARAEELLNQGIEANRENEPLNAEMRRMISSLPKNTTGGDEPLSLTQLFLQQNTSVN